MNACDFSVFSKFDLGRCVASVAFGWVPDWVWMVLPYWPWIVVVGGGLLVYRHFGWGGLVLFAGGLGFLAGRKWGHSSIRQPPVEDDEIWPPPHPKPQRRKKPGTTSTIFNGGLDKLLGRGRR